ncbi:hypothetical protein WJX77_007949 [Trebouxia sp. C0004]
MTPAEVEHLQNALQSYQESLADLDTLRQTGQNLDDTQEVYLELVDAIALTQDALYALQSTPPKEEDQKGNNSQEDEASVETQTHDLSEVQTSPAAALPQSDKAQPGVSHKRQLQQLHHSQPVKRQKQGLAPSSTTISIGPQPLQQHVTQNSATAQARADMAKTSIHPRNKYADKLPDFKLLSQIFPDLQPHVKLNQHGSASIDFRQPDACKALTKALLMHDFNIAWDVPEGQLVPPITNRANYIHWLEDLLLLSSPTGSETIKGLDIGCGANCIYPLLGAALNGWHFVGTDITGIAIEWAGKNVQGNLHLAHLIEIRRTEHSSQPLDSTNIEQGILLPAVQDGETFSFCMCNPPFFETLQEAGRNPNTAYAGTSEEMVCPGGELAFVTQMVKDSLKLQGRVHWYSSMVGKKATLKQLRRILHESNVTALRTTELVQGRTSRWAIAWSFAADPQTAGIPMPRYATVSGPVIGC